MEQSKPDFNQFDISTINDIQPTYKPILLTVEISSAFSGT